MASQMFERKPVNVEGTFTADKAKLIFSSGISGVLVQGMNFSYAQQVTRLYEIGDKGNTSNVYYVSGRTQGTMGLNRVVGPSANVTAYYKNYGNVCESCDKSITLNLSESACCGSGGSSKLKYGMQGCVITQVGVNVQANDMLINESTQLMFSGLTYA